jgi:hypothetical protein
VNSADATASGLPYPVVAVSGEAPRSLDQFVGTSSFTVDKGSGESSVSGVGVRNDDGVRFQEKAGLDGKDVRVWQIRQVAEQRLTAESIAAF